MTKLDEAEIEIREALRKEGALGRDTQKPNPYFANTVNHYMYMQGWLLRDLQLCLARANVSYRKTQLGAGTITKEGIEGGYGFDPVSSPLVGY